LRSTRGIKTYGETKDLSEFKFATDLHNFTEDYQYPVPGDFSRISSYGEVLRDEKPTIVVIDFEFSSSVS